MDCYEAILRRQREIDKALYGKTEQLVIKSLHDGNAELGRMLQALTKQAHRSITVSHPLEYNDLGEPLLPTADRRPKTTHQTASRFFACFPCLRKGNT
ncbi:MAG: hypothetical protein P0S94_03100 [Simkaniaceae bacterium]|nr:hypothetical protein [Simkaniaceae bacterium]